MLPQKQNRAKELEVGVGFLGKSVPFIPGHQVGANAAIGSDRLDHLLGFAEWYPGVVLTLDNHQRNPDPIDLIEW
jgi:hypothetical protein